MAIVYLLVALFSTLIGACTGMGGGVIIKPALDAISSYNPFVIGVLSSATVLSMSLVPTTRCIINKIKISKHVVLLAIGATIGGLLGKEIFSHISAITTDKWLTTIQAIAIIILLIIVLFKNKLPMWHIKNTFMIIFIGLLLGALSAFLGIGGGPINVAILCMFFAMDIKEAVTGSIFIILFSQAAKLSSIALTTGFMSYDYSMLFYMIPGGILGGVFGTWLKHRLENIHIEKVFYLIVVFVILLNVYNILSLQLF